MAARRPVSGLLILAALLIVPLEAQAQQVTPSAAEPEMPPLPSLEGQQGEVISQSAVSAPARKRRADEAVRPAAAPSAAKGMPAGPAKPSPGKTLSAKAPPEKAAGAEASAKGPNRRAGQRRGPPETPALRPATVKPAPRRSGAPPAAPEGRPAARTAPGRRR